MIRDRRIHLLTVLLIFLAACTQLTAQVTGKGETSSAKSALGEMIGRLSPSTETPSSPLEGPIDQNQYVVGPGDVLAVSVWGAMSLTYQLTVTPEGTLIIPTVGELKVAGTKLFDVKEKVSVAVKGKYLSTKITTTLIAPRAFIVTVTGSILNQGQYRALSVDRVERVVVQASRVYLPTATVTIESRGGAKEGLYNDPKMNQVAEIFTNISTRNILLIRSNGDTLKVDIPKFYATKNDRHNPFLLEGDIVFVPRKDLGRNFVSVQGAVNAPGKYEYVEGDSLFDALLIAQGVTPQVDLSRIGVNRLDNAGETAEELSLNILNEGAKANIRLRRGDRITVGEVPNQRLDYRVQVLGEVKSPGYYPISMRGTRLSKIIDGAGGFTQEALLSGSFVSRVQDRPFRLSDPGLDNARNFRSFGLHGPDSVYYFLNAEIGFQPVVVDFARLIELKDSTQDIILRDGDVIYVPSNTLTVVVGGQVTNPGHLPFIRGADYRYYIQKAGGFSEYADAGETKIIKKATLEWMNPAETTIESGDQVWVPKKPRHEFYYYFSIGRDIIAVVTSIITAAYIMIQVSK